MTLDELEDEAARPEPPAYPAITRAERAHGRRLAAIHDMYRAELDGVRHLLDRIRAGTTGAEALAPAVAGTRLARNMALFGTACGRDCALLQNHHDIEERWMFPSLSSAGGAALVPVIARLKAEHRLIHALIQDLEAAAGALVAAPDAGAFARCAEGFAVLDQAIRSHFGYEERVLEAPLGALRVPI